MKNTVVILEPKGIILEVVRAAKARGYRTVALASDPKLLKTVPAPYNSAVAMIDEDVAVESWNDHGPILESVAKIHASGEIAGIYSGMDPCAPVFAAMRVKYGLPTPSVETIFGILDKHHLRKTLRAKGLSRLTNHHSNEADHWTAWPFQGAAYFKPVHGCLSAYVVRCESLEDLKIAREKWRSGNPDEPAYVRDYLHSVNEYHVEEAIQGELLSIEAFISGGRFHSLGLLSRILYSKDPVVEMGSCFPYPHALEEKITRVVREAHSALGFNEGVTHTEVIVSKSGEVEIIDLNPRFVGADVLQSINHAYDTKIQEALLDFALGQPLKLPTKARQFSCLQYFLPPEVPVFEGVSFPKTPEIKFQLVLRAPGTVLKHQNRQIDYLGCYLTVMPTFESAIARSKELRSEVLINGTNPGVY